MCGEKVLLHRCYISGAVCEDLVVCPRWMEDTRQLKHRLEGFVCMAPQLFHACNGLLEDTPAQEDRWTVQSING